MEKKSNLNKSESENYLGLLAIQEDLEKKLDQMKKREREYEIRIDEYQNDLKLRQKQINKLHNESNELKIVNENLKEQLNLKNIEIKRIKMETQEELKNRETLIQQQIKDRVNNINAENTRQKQLLINEFKQAQELLKYKLNQSKQEIKDLNDKIAMRESRQEDLETINTLKCQLVDYEEKLKRLKDEKRNFQMELLNRENNFNKTFLNYNNSRSLNSKSTFFK